mgnify:CR=1 FL=1
MSEYINVSEIFGEDVFDDEVMQQRLPKKSLQRFETDHIRGQRVVPGDGGCHCSRNERVGHRKKAPLIIPIGFSRLPE